MSAELQIIFMVLCLMVGLYFAFLGKKIQDLETKYEWQCKRIDSLFSSLKQMEKWNVTLSDALITTNKVLDRIIKEKDEGN